MDCLHLKSAVDAGALAGVPDITNFTCRECHETSDIWLCLSCAAVNCGRYSNKHSLKHHEENPDHTVVIKCATSEIFCYSCDEFPFYDVTMRMPEIKKLRDILLSRSYDSSVIISEDSNISCASDSSNLSTDSNRATSNKRQSSQDRENPPRGSENAKKPKKDIKTIPQNLRSSGLRNLGNTCFMNAVLQSLSNLPQFCCYFKKLPALDEKFGKLKNGRRIYQTRRNNGGADDVLLSEEVRKILIELWAGSKTAISPDSLFNVIWKVVPRFRGFQQQDAHEFLCYILDRLHTELLNILPHLPAKEEEYIGQSKGSKSTIVTAIFGGVLQSEVTCLVCRSESKKHDPFLDLSVTIPYQAEESKGATNPTQSCCLQDCLKSFTELEVLSESELYHCAPCKIRQRSTKKFSIRRLPNVLCIHLKRFRWCNSYRQKVNTYVSFPTKGLDMSVYMLENMPETRGTCSSGNLYDLAAIIVHHGTGAGSGHYTSYAYNEGHWYHFNDSSVSLTDEDTVSKCKAYILFYVRRRFKLPEMK